jgi:hypothetical protein
LCTSCTSKTAATRIQYVHGTSSAASGEAPEQIIDNPSRALHLAAEATLRCSTHAPSQIHKPALRPQTDIGLASPAAVLILAQSLAVFIPRWPDRRARHEDSQAFVTSPVAANKGT